LAVSFQHVNLNAGHSSSENNFHYTNPAEITPFQKAEQIREARRQKTRAGDLLTGTTVTVALEAGIEARAKPFE
jgi:hypothetical protein